MESERIFHVDKRIRSPKSQFWTPNRPEFMKNILQVVPVRVLGRVALTSAQKGQQHLLQLFVSRRP